MLYSTTEIGRLTSIRATEANMYPSMLASVVRMDVSLASLLLSISTADALLRASRICIRLLSCRHSSSSITMYDHEDAAINKSRWPALLREINDVQS